MILDHPVLLLCEHGGDPLHGEEGFRARRIFPGVVSKPASPKVSEEAER